MHLSYLRWQNIAAMDLIDYKARYGRGALRSLSIRTGLGDYIYQLSSGAKACSLTRAELLKRYKPRLNLVALMKMRERLGKSNSNGKPAAPKRRRTRVAT